MRARTPTKYAIELPDPLSVGLYPVFDEPTVLGAVSKTDAVADDGRDLVSGEIAILRFPFLKLFSPVRLRGSMCEPAIPSPDQRAAHGISNRCYNDNERHCCQPTYPCARCKNDSVTNTIEHATRLHRHWWRLLRRQPLAEESTMGFHNNNLDGNADNFPYG